MSPGDPDQYLRADEPSAPAEPFGHVALGAGAGHDEAGGKVRGMRAVRLQMPLRPGYAGPAEAESGGLPPGPGGRSEGMTRAKAVKLP